jgi:hypothetical protein
MQALTLTRTARPARMPNRTARTPLRRAAVDRSLVAAATAFVASTLLVLAMLPAFASAGSGAAADGPMPVPAPSYAPGNSPGPLPAPAPDFLGGPDDLGPVRA